MMLEDNDQPKCTRLEKIGFGTYGKVYKAKLAIGEMSRGVSSECIALKVIAICDVEDMQNARNEAELLRIAHGGQYVVQMHFAFASDDKTEFNIACELAIGDLACQRSTVDTLVASAHCIRGMAEVHRHGIMHRDLKLENFLLVMTQKGEGVVKISDLSLGIHKSDSKDTNVQTSWYRAPELLIPILPYNSAIDLWALGQVLHHLVEGRAKFMLDGKPLLHAIFQDACIHPVPTTFEHLIGVKKMPVRQLAPHRWIDGFAQINPLQRVTAIHVCSSDAELVGQRACALRVTKKRPRSPEIHCEESLTECG
jgi:serine/threonine protein kinase